MAHLCQYLELIYGFSSSGCRGEQPLSCLTERLNFAAAALGLARKLVRWQVETGSDLSQARQASLRSKMIIILAHTETSIGGELERG